MMRTWYKPESGFNDKRTARIVWLKAIIAVRNVQRTIYVEKQGIPWYSALVLDLDKEIGALQRELDQILEELNGRG